MWYRGVNVCWTTSTLDILLVVKHLIRLLAISPGVKV